MADHGENRRPDPQRDRRAAREVRIADSTVMGRLPVLVLATAMAGVAIMQLFDGLGSQLIIAVGGKPLDYAWSGALLLAATLVWIARLHPRREIAATLEILGSLLIVVALLAYLAALRDQYGWAGSGLIVALGLSTAINLTGRAFLLWRRMRELRKAIA